MKQEKVQKINDMLDATGDLINNAKKYVDYYSKCILELEKLQKELNLLKNQYIKN